MINLPCPICRAESILLDVVDLNKSCEELRGKFIQLSGIPVYYTLCNNCGFCWAPELHDWSIDKFERYIYNENYIEIDPDYTYARPKANADNLRSMFPALPETIKHLDYGGGNGLLSELLRRTSWDSFSYDPFVQRNMKASQLGRFGLVTAFEVFEHIPDVHELMSDLGSVVSDEGLVLFSTMLSDGDIRPHQRLSWWYASPRNGHISLFTTKSLVILAEDYGFHFGSFSRGFHVFFRKMPSWAYHLMQKS